MTRPEIIPDGYEWHDSKLSGIRASIAYFFASAGAIVALGTGIAIVAAGIDFFGMVLDAVVIIGGTAAVLLVAVMGFRLIIQGGFSLLDWLCGGGWNDRLEQQWLSQNDKMGRRQDELDDAIRSQYL